MPDEEEEGFVDAPSEPEDNEDLRVFTHQESAIDPGEPLDIPESSGEPSTKPLPTVTPAQHNEVQDTQGDISAEIEQGKTLASGLSVPTSPVDPSKRSLDKRPLSTVDSNGAQTSFAGGTSVDADSTSSLLRPADMKKEPATAEVDLKPVSTGILGRAKKELEMRSSSGQLKDEESTTEPLSRKRTLRNLVKFDIPEDSRRATMHLKAKKAQMTIQRQGTKIRRQRIKDGIVVKMERMLVRVDAAKEVPDDFDENVNQRVVSRVKDQWREYMVVCRHSHSEGADFVLQFNKTRVSQHNTVTILIC